MAYESHFILLCVFFVPWIIASKIIRGSYIVEYSNYEDKDIHQSIHDDLMPYRSHYEVLHMFRSSLFNGMSIKLKYSPDNRLNLTKKYYDRHTENHPVLKRLVKHPSVVKLYPVYKLLRPQWESDTTNYTFPYSNSISQIFDAHSQLGITGKNILIGVLDSGLLETQFNFFFLFIFPFFYYILFLSKKSRCPEVGFNVGIDYNHPALGGGFGRGYKIRYGANLVPEEEDEKYGVELRGDSDPYDPCTGNDAGIKTTFL